MIPLYVIAQDTKDTDTEEMEELLQTVEDLQKEVEDLKERQEKLEWEILSVESKIKHLAEEYGVDESLALNIACVESRFKPKAANPVSTAGGVFQWLDGSWAHYSTHYYGEIRDKWDEDENIRLSMKVLRDFGPGDWEVSRRIGQTGGWERKPYERGFC